MNILVIIAIVGISLIVGILLDRSITLKKNKEHKIIKMQAYTDQLTGKGNRHKFTQDIELLIKKNKKFAVCFMDLDGFKNINDTMGHDAGDILLIELGNKLDEFLPKTSESYRLGGDEFAILMQDINTVAEITAQLENLKKGLTTPVIIEGVKIVLEYSLGIAIYPQDAKTRTELMTFADDAMYFIKEHGKNDYYFHNDVLKAKLENKKKMEIGLKAAVENNEFLVEYTPRIGINEYNIGLESRIVWNHPVLGRIEEEYFMKQAEEIGIVVLLDEYLIKKTCEKIKYLLSKGIKNVKMYVNICNLHVKRNDFISKLVSIISSFELPKGVLQLCFSEKLELKYLNGYKNFSQEMKKIGVEVAMSNLELRIDILKTFKEIEIEYIKLDSGYLSLESSFNENLIKDIISVCKDLDYKVEVIGINSKDELEKIVLDGADFIEGKYLSETYSEDRLDEYIKNYKKISTKIYDEISEIKK